MRVFIAGIDGYIGWPLAQYLANKGYEVFGADNTNRRRWVEEVGGSSIIPIESLNTRRHYFFNTYGPSIIDWVDFTNYNSTKDILSRVEPDVIIHLAEMPSAPYSMMGAEHAVYTHNNNLGGTINILYAIRDVCPDAHLIKLGTMGEYGYLGLDIPEGFFEVEYRGKKSVMPFPKRPGSYYHATKVHDTHNISMACDMWGLRSTDIMQGIVYGTRVDGMQRGVPFNTRFDVDACFGTVLNRFCAQAILGVPLSLYGRGRQKRGFLPLCDSLQCLSLVLDNPPEKGEYRVFNQFEDVLCLEDLAFRVVNAAKRMGIQSQVRRIENPRHESEDHYYNPENKKLLDLGYKPSHNLDSILLDIMGDILGNYNRLESVKGVLLPNTKW